MVEALTVDLEMAEEEVTTTAVETCITAIIDYVDIIDTTLASGNQVPIVDIDAISTQLSYILNLALDWELWELYDKVIKILHVLIKHSEG